VNESGLIEFMKVSNIDFEDIADDFSIPELDLKTFHDTHFPEIKHVEFDAIIGSTEGEDDIPEIPKESRVRLGDLYQLGGHRLLCGDCTVKENVERLMNGEKADMVFTDPPYGMNLNTDYSSMGKSDHNYAKVIGDNVDFEPGYIFDLFGYCKEIFLFGADYYCERIPKKNDGSWVVWDKRQSDRLDIPTTLDKSFGSCFELVWSKGKHKRDIARFVWCAGLGEGKEEERIGRNNSPKRVHSTQKPIDLCSWFFERWGKDAMNIWDGYLGSGSTLIACEKTNRKCFGMEIDPTYVSVILDRWAKFTGKDPVREDGKIWGDIKNG